MIPKTHRIAIDSDEDRCFDKYQLPDEDWQLWVQKSGGGKYIMKSDRSIEIFIPSKILKEVIDLPRICDGCFGPPEGVFEHKCHGLHATVRGDATGKPCECEDEFCRQLRGEQPSEEFLQWKKENDL